MDARGVGNVDADLLEIEEVLGMRYCDPSQMTAVALRNPVDEDDERLEYLVSGRFGSGPDDRGFHSVAWVFDGDLLDHVDAEEVKSAMQAYKNRMDKEFAALADACDADMYMLAVPAPHVRACDIRGLDRIVSVVRPQSRA